jgi:hypothetical protein
MADGEFCFVLLILSVFRATPLPVRWEYPIEFLPSAQPRLSLHRRFSVEDRQKDQSLFWICGALALIASSVTCIVLLESRRARRQRVMDQALQDWEGEGGAVPVEPEATLEPV